MMYREGIHMSLKKLLETHYDMPLKDILIEFYINKDLSEAEVAKKLQVSNGIVHKWLKDNKISKQKLF